MSFKNGVLRKQKRHPFMNGCLFAFTRLGEPYITLPALLINLNLRLCAFRIPDRLYKNDRFDEA
jgi:hypothetical protein